MKDNRVILFLLITVICAGTVFAVLNDQMINRLPNVEEGLTETDKFRNPQFNENTIWNIKKAADKRNIELSKIMPVSLLLFDFNLRNIENKDIPFRSIDNIYERYSNDKEFNYFCNVYGQIINDLKYFPVKYDRNKKYEFAYDDSYGSPRNFEESYTHEGTDIMAMTNKSGIYEIVSVCDGTVEKVGWLRKGGYRVGIRGKSGGYFYYAHLAKGSIMVSENMDVKAGEVIGLMGSTGYGEEGTKDKFPVHLHFGIYIKTNLTDELSVNPYYYLKYLEHFPIYY